jgi:hypothetical protein
MFCESYRQALTDAALGAALPPAVERHLAACETCRAAFDREVALARSIDEALAAAVNVRVPPSLVARVRAGVSAGGGRTAWRLEARVVLGALAVLALIVWAAASVHRDAPARPSGETTVARRAEAHGRKEDAGRAALPRAAAAVRRAVPARSALRASRSEPEVLVAPEEKAGFERYVAQLGTASRESRAVDVQGAAGMDIQPLQIAAMSLRQLAVEPLESGDSN